MKQNAVLNFIRGLKLRKSHYYLRDTDKVYLPEELNISNLSPMYPYHNSKVS